MCNCNTKSALDKNLNAKANSKNPSETLTVFNHPPEFGNYCIQAGNKANNINGNAMAEENPNIPTIGAIPPLEADSTRSVPTIGPVHEKETIAKANAIKNIPTTPDLLDFLSTTFAHEFGNTISKPPKNEMAKNTNIIKKQILNMTLVDSAFNASAPKIPVISNPKTT